MSHAKSDHKKTTQADLLAQLAAQMISGGVTPELLELLTNPEVIKALTEAAATRDATNTVLKGKDTTKGTDLINTLCAQVAHHQNNDEKATPEDSREPTSRGR
jgi:hypothetical protein